MWSVLLCLLVVLPALRRPNKERETNKMRSLGLCFFSCPQILGGRERVFSLSLLYLGHLVSWHLRLRCTDSRWLWIPCAISHYFFV